MSKFKHITLVQTVKHTVTFEVDDFETETEFNEFVTKLKNDSDFRADAFLDNIDRKNFSEDNCSDIEIEN
jgi:hypothetical protein